jgi:hypothetical protein
MPNGVLISGMTSSSALVAMVEPNDQTGHRLAANERGKEWDGLAGISIELALEPEAPHSNELQGSKEVEKQTWMIDKTKRCYTSIGIVVPCDPFQIRLEAVLRELDQI